MSNNDTEVMENKSLLKDSEYQKKIAEMKDDMFNDVQEIIFTENKEGKLIGRLPNGKFVLLNKNEDSKNIMAGLPYVCILRHFEKVAFAKVIAQVFIPKVIFSKLGIILVYKDENGSKREKIKNIDYLMARLKTLDLEKILVIVRDWDNKMFNVDKKKKEGTKNG